MSLASNKTKVTGSISFVVSKVIGKISAGAMEVGTVTRQYLALSSTRRGCLCNISSKVGITNVISLLCGLVEDLLKILLLIHKNDSIFLVRMQIYDEGEASSGAFWKSAEVWGDKVEYCVILLSIRKFEWHPFCFI